MSIKELINAAGQIDFQKNSRSKYIRIKVNLEGKVTVTYPLSANKKMAEQFLLKNKNWVVEQVTKIKSPAVHIKTGLELSFKGQKILLGVLYADKKRSRISFQNNRLMITLEKHFMVHEEQSILQHNIIQWYRKQAKLYIESRLQHFNKHYHFSYNTVRIKEQRSLWGSCSSKKNLNFNWKIMLAPEEIADYLVVHELCHLKEMNHSERFWSLVGETIPDYKARRDWLRANQGNLKLF